MVTNARQSGARHGSPFGAGLAALTPVGPPALNALTPVGPPALNALTPVGPPALNVLTPVGPPALNALTPVGPPQGNSFFTPVGPPPHLAQMFTAALPSLPWDGIDPSWVYGSGAGMLAQALRKSRAKIVRSADLDVRRNHAHGMDLWQWESQWRVNALQSELLGRFQVQGCALFLTELVEMGPNQNTNRVHCNRVFDIRKHRGASFDNQVDMVLRAAAEREDRLPEILSQADSFWPFFESVVGANVAFSPHLGELLAVAHGVAVHVVMALKQAVAARRPVQCSTLVAPVITTPGHGSLPSGHATLSALYSELLRGLLYPGNSAFELERCTQLDRLARRIAFNRVVAGVHFQFDSVVGYALGTQLARVLLRMAGHRRAPPALVNDDSFDVIGGKDLTLNEAVGDRPAETPGTYPCSVCPGFAELWRRTQLELKPLRV